MYFSGKWVVLHNYNCALYRLLNTCCMLCKFRLFKSRFQSRRRPRLEFCCRCTSEQTSATPGRRQHCLDGRWRSAEPWGSIRRPSSGPVPPSRQTYSDDRVTDPTDRDWFDIVIDLLFYFFPATRCFFELFYLSIIVYCGRYLQLTFPFYVTQ